jgi:hypothetical protein
MLGHIPGIEPALGAGVGAHKTVLLGRVDGDHRAAHAVVHRPLAIGLVFVLVLFSVVGQGTLVPWVARRQPRERFAAGGVGEHEDVVAGGQVRGGLGRKRAAVAHDEADPVAGLQFQLGDGLPVGDRVEGHGELMHAAWLLAQADRELPWSQRVVVHRDPELAGSGRSPRPWTMRSSTRSRLLQDRIAASHMSTASTIAAAKTNARAAETPSRNATTLAERIAATISDRSSKSLRRCSTRTNG